MVQYDLPSGLYFRKGQTFGSLQHAPQPTHLPLRFLETGSIAVIVLFVLASHVFLFCSAIIGYLHRITSTDISADYPQIL